MSYEDDYIVELENKNDKLEAQLVEQKRAMRKAQEWGRKKIAKRALQEAVLLAVAKAPYDDSDLASLLQGLRTMAKDALADAGEVE